MIRKITPKVKNGRVQKKNRHDFTPNYWNTRQAELQFDTLKPGKGYKHFLNKSDIKRFLEILPNWKEIDIELDAILLSEGGGPDGWYHDGKIAICAWPKDRTSSFTKEYFNDHKRIFDQLNVKYEIKKDGVVCHFEEGQIKAYQLLHIFLHEIGHHHDRISTKKRIDLPNGEPFAESYAEKYEKIIWHKYFEEFGY